MKHRIWQRLRDNRGEAGIIPVVAGSIMFLFASMAIAGFLVVILGSGAQAQGDTELKAQMSTQIQAWEKTPWGSLHESANPNDTIAVAGHTRAVSSSVVYIPATTSYQYTLSAPLSVAPGTTPANCKNVTTKAPGCIVLTGTKVATPDDITPAPPAGVTLAVEQIGADGHTTNLLPDPGFESGKFGAWAAAGSGANVIASTPAHTSGGYALDLKGATAAAVSAWVPVAPDDQIRAQAWARSLSASGTFQLRATFKMATGGDQTSIIQNIGADGTSWGIATGTLTAPPGASAIKLTVGTTGCDSACHWIVDDTATYPLNPNLIPDPGVEVTPSAWVTNAPATRAQAVNRTSVGTHTVRLTGPASSASSAGVTAFSPGDTYSIAEWVRMSGGSSATGTVIVEAKYGSTTKTVSTADINGLGNGWVFISGNIVAPNPKTTLTVNVRVAGMATGASVDVDDFAVHRVTAVIPNPAIDGYIKVADLSQSVLGQRGANLRVSYRSLGAGTAPADMQIALFCTNATDSLPMADNTVEPVPDNAGWFWSRITIPALDRIAGCTAPNLRLFSGSGHTPDPSTVGNVSILRVLDGITQPGTGS